MKRLMEKLNKQNGESMAEAMAAMLVLAFGVIVFSAMIIQAGKLMDRGEAAMQQYYEGQNALLGRDTAAAEVTEEDGSLEIASPFGENDFAGLTPALRRGEGNSISIRMYRQRLQNGKEEASETDENNSCLFTYDTADSGEENDDTGRKMYAGTEMNTDEEAGTGKEASDE